MIATAVYSAKCWATSRTKKEIQDEISELENLWKIKHKNPFSRNAHWTHCKIITLKEILAER
jgi:hypothetical protein